MKIYLAGPITGGSYKQVTGWRREVFQQLLPYGVRCFSPMRQKEHLIDMDSIPATTDGYCCAVQEVMARDFNDCITSDLLFVNLLGTETISVGTAMELAWAYYLHIPVVVCVESTNIHLKHPMISEAIKVRASTLNEGISKAKTFLIGGI